MGSWLVGWLVGGLQKLKTRPALPPQPKNHGKLFKGWRFKQWKFVLIWRDLPLENLSVSTAGHSCGDCQAASVKTPKPAGKRSKIDCSELVHRSVYIRFR